MKSVKEEIEIYEKYVRLEKSTIYTYKLYLMKFISYLSIKTGLEPTDIHLHKFRALKDSNDLFLRYLPIDSDTIDGYFSTINMRSYNVLNDTYKALMSFFKFLENNYNLMNPMKKIMFKPKDYLPKNDNFKRALTRGEVIKLLNSITHHSTHFSRDILLFVLLLLSLRVSEVINLKCCDIDLHEDTLMILKTKNKHQRIVPLRSGMGNGIQKYINKNQRDGSDYLFIKDNHKPFTRKDVNNLKDKYKALAKIPPFKVHDLRRTFATLMAEQGSPIHIISQLLGHESLAATKDYINPHYVRNKNLIIPEHKVIIDFLNEKI